MTDRPITEEDLHAYVEGRLDDARMAAVRGYLADHPEIAETLAGYSADRAMLRDALRPFAEAPIPPTLDVRRLVEARRGRSDAWRMPVAASLALAAGLAGGWAMRGVAVPQNGVAALAREAAESYRVYANDTTRPVEIAAADEPKLVAWVSDRLQRRVVPPDLTAAGFRLLGGRLVTTPHGPAAMFLYEGAKSERLAVVVRPMANDETTRMSEHGDHGVGGVAWANKGLGYSLVGSASARELHPIADEVRRAAEAHV
ncbi:MAG TPA: anti-sigma factor [Phenylobacterium sp.]|jgi:anti-sigma factor RsiW|uniref:anti-sigma factor family protein n=1 Tax=Phenylobacterium sp. TaxID=1871053 RepID=UPI002BB5329D|nr:anti-sigma factor [Phenylobacterium sp.]HXA39643.1 anti-sigma factor [Phenylobacterium sp.]